MSLLEYLRSETTIAGTDIKYVLLAACVFAVYRLLVSNLFLKPLSILVSEKHRYKFVHRGFDAIHYLTASIIGLLAFSQRPYGHCPFYFLNCRPYIGCTGENVVCSVFEKIYYYVFSAYYFSDVLWIKTNKTYVIFTFHHIMTLGMLYVCILSARHVVGMSIMLLHDCVDVFLYVGKITSYLEIKKISDISFLIFAVSFLYLRLFGCLGIIYIIVTDEKPQPHHYWAYFIGRTFFCGLYCCHIIWGSQIIKALIKIFQGDKIHDTRSDPADDKKTQKVE